MNGVKTFLDRIVRIWKTDQALVLTGFNLFCALVFLLTADPFGLFRRTYGNADPFFPYSTSELERIQIGRRGYETVLEKRNGTWVVDVRGISGRSDERKVFYFLNMILNLRKFFLLETDSGKREEYGLAGDELRLEVETGSGEISALEIGIAGAGGNGAAVRTPTTGEIWLVEENLNAAAGRGDEEFFFSKRPFSESLDPQEIHTILIFSPKNPESVFEWRRTSREEWEQVRGNRNDLCGPKECGTWIAQTLNVSADRILKKPFREKVLPLAPTEGISVEFRTDSDSIHKFEWIGTTEQKEPVFKTETDSVFFVMEPSFLDRFRKPTANEGPRF
ncbi:hypothetical protein CH375_13130 [Leptospira ellisii]|uniref:DUF4340 domain-containing protein n=1 Tax=Leptospira ellisii TaxID=2023197 RepID=A0A2N0BC43_9LEPT|nr:hypothetical protein CH379_04105 [Leptospira ellisii]PKA04077.1 hypothetical protein CH375_13130 [Leptospira ellisii]